MKSKARINRKFYFELYVKISTFIMIYETSIENKETVGSVDI
jgi:hypothetical protein